MLRVRLSALLGERRLRISDVARDTGINRGTLTRLYYETAERIELPVVEALCAYLQCDVGDLLRRDHPCQRRPEADSLSGLLGSQPTASPSNGGNQPPS